MDWVDGEWSQTAQNAIGRLWAMHQDCSSARIEEKVVHARLMKEIYDEKMKIEKKYSDMVDDVNRFIKETSKSTMQANYERIQKEGKESELMRQNQISIELLQSKLAELQEVHRSQAAVLKAKQQKWDEEKEVLKEEKKNVEYMLFDLLKLSDANKDKLKRIKAICDEPVGDQ